MKKAIKDSKGSETASPFANYLHSTRDPQGLNIKKYFGKLKDTIKTHPLYERAKDYLKDAGYEAVFNAKDEWESMKRIWKPYTKEELAVEYSTDMKKV